MWTSGVVLLVTATAIAQRPDYMPFCYRSDPNLNECVRKNLQTVMPRLAQGDADLDLPTLDPFHFDLDELRFQQWNIYGSAKARNTTSTGNKDMAVRSVRANLKDPTRFEMEVDVFHPQILIRGEYDIEGRLLAFRLNGSGIYNLTLNAVHATWKLRGELEGRFMRATRFGLSCHIDNLSMYASDLVFGNRDLNQVVLRFINSRWAVIEPRINPALDRAFNSSMLPLANKVFLKVPYDQLFPASIDVGNATSSKAAQ